jgi:hypothetical protein
VLYALIVVQALLTTSGHFLSHWPGVKERYSKHGVLALAVLSATICLATLYTAHNQNVETLVFQNSMTGGNSAPLALPEDTRASARLMILNFGSSNLPEVWVRVQDRMLPGQVAMTRNVGPIPKGIWAPYADDSLVEFPAITGPSKLAVRQLLVTMTTRNAVFTEALDLISSICLDPLKPSYAYQYKLYATDTPSDQDVPLVATHYTPECQRTP